MAGDTKERIMETALELFAQNGYLGTSMNDIAKQLSITKAALYKHYTGKQEILDRITERMKELDTERAKRFEMPEGDPAKAAGFYRDTPSERIRAYSKAQFLHWTEDGFPSSFRKMLTLEQYRDKDLAELYQSCLASGPISYMTEIFKEMSDSDEAAEQLALEFYGPIYLLYSVYDGSDDKEKVISMLDEHISRFIRRMEAELGKAGK